MKTTFESHFYFYLAFKQHGYEHGNKKNLDTVLYQFLETGESDRTLMGLFQLLKCLGFSLYPLSFFLYSPFK